MGIYTTMNITEAAVNLSNGVKWDELEKVDAGGGVLCMFVYHDSSLVLPKDKIRVVCEGTDLNVPLLAQRGLEEPQLEPMINTIKKKEIYPRIPRKEKRNESN